MRRSLAALLLCVLAAACSEGGERDPQAEPKALIVALHATGSDAERFADISRLEEHAPDAVVQYVDGIDGRWSADDVERIADIVDELVASRIADADRVSLVGFSGGGAMALRAAAVDGERYAAVASVASQLPRDVAPTTEIPAVLFYGRDDPLRPFDGLDVAPTEDGPIPTIGTLATAYVFAMFGAGAADGDAGPAPVLLPDLDPDDGTTVTRTSWRLHAPVDLYVVEGGGHTWPGTPVQTSRQVDGRTTRDVDASALIVDFFREHGAL